MIQCRPLPTIPMMKWIHGVIIIGIWLFIFILPDSDADGAAVRRRHSVVLTPGDRKPSRVPVPIRGLPRRNLIAEATDTTRRTRIRRTGGEDYYEWNYEGTYDYDEETKEEEKTFLEKINSKMTKKFIVTAIIVANLVLCCGCGCCLVCGTVCKEFCIATRRFILDYCDKLCCRDPNYRKVQEMMKRLDLQPPTYSEYKILRDSYGIPPGH